MCYGLPLGGIETSWVISVLTVLRVTFVLLVLYFNPMLPIAP